MEGSMTLDPKIYRRAAIEIAEFRSFFIDPAIRCFIDGENYMESWKVYSDTFWYWLDPGTYSNASLDVNDRSLALLFMEQIAKDLMKEKNL